MSVTSISLFKFSGILDKTWAFRQMLEARWRLATTPEIQFYKLLGSGTRDGFYPYPNFGVYGLLAVWPSLESAQKGTCLTPAFRRFRSHAFEHWTVFMSATQSRGKWSGRSPFNVKKGNNDLNSTSGLTAVLTRATIKAIHVPSFWKQVPAISHSIVNQRGMLFKIGLGEVPWLHQATFTIWCDSEALDKFAFRGPHGTAIANVRAGDWFKEELFVRFQVLGTDGDWPDACKVTKLTNKHSPAIDYQ